MNLRRKKEQQSQKEDLHLKNITDRNVDKNHLSLTHGKELVEESQ